jgi:GTPase SAR1 family protein
MTCLEGTRMTLLADLDAWATSSDGAPFFWLNGLAGTGKSTVARTLCESISKRKDTPMVLASFSVSRHSTDRRKAINILHTLVYQLALQDSAIRSSVSQAIAQEPDLITRSLSQQVKKLLRNSISGTEGSHPIILVLDALDECEADSQGREGGQLLIFLARLCSESKRSVKLLVTSRLEPTIREMFDEIQALASASRSKVVQLHDIDRDVVREDIQRYLVHSFNKIARRVKAANWPTEAQVALLLDNADVLFIYAATVVRYIGHRQFDPRKRLEQVLTRTDKSAQSAYRQLDGLYHSVLSNALSGASVEVEDEPEIAERLQTMLGTVVLVLQRLSPSTIAGLLDWSVHETELALTRLTAVFIIHEDEPIRIFHPSFPDFLLDDSRCTDARLQVNARNHHAILARQCLSVMNSLLHKDVLETGLNPLIRNWQLNGVNARIEQFMSSHLQYAVCHWMNHVVESALDDEGLQQALETFCHTHLLHWLECLSYLQKLDVAVSGLPTVIGHLVVRQLHHDNK